MKRLAVIAIFSFAGCDQKKAEPAPPPAREVEVVKKAEPTPPPAPEKTEIEVPDFVVSTEPADIKKGEEVYASKGCNACHKVGGGRLVGPDLKGVTARRDEAWLKKMILRPDVMIKEDEVAKKLFVEHLTPMPNQGVDPKTELPFIMSYLKSVEK